RGRTAPAIVPGGDALRQADVATPPGATRAHRSVAGERSLPVALRRHGRPRPRIRALLEPVDGAQDPVPHSGNDFVGDRGRMMPPISHPDQKVCVQERLEVPFVDLAPGHAILLPELRAAFERVLAN